MKRLLVCLMTALLLTGCGAEKKPTIPVPEGEADEALAAQAGAAYAAITEDLTFSVAVEEPDGTVTELDIVPDNAWNVAGREDLFAFSYQWYPADAADWEAQLAVEERGILFTMSDEVGTLAYCSGGDVVRWENGGTEGYAFAVNPKEGQAPYEGKFELLLRTVAEDAWSELNWSGAVDGSLAVEAAAAALAEQVAESVRSTPDWVRWKPQDFCVSGTNVFDIYRGEPENFCCGMSFRVKMEDFGSPDAGHWQVGSGIDEFDREGYGAWGREVLVEKNADGDWTCTGVGTGGYSVLLPVQAEEASLEELLDAFFLAEGNTHDWLLPCYILSQSPETLSRLPELLAERSEVEVQDLCGTLMGCYQRYDEMDDGDDIPGAAYPEDWVSQAELRTVLGDYGSYFSA